MYSCSSTAPVSLACHCAAATRLIGHSVDPPLTKPNAFAEISPLSLGIHTHTPPTAHCGCAPRPRAHLSDSKIRSGTSPLEREI